MTGPPSTLQAYYVLVPTAAKARHQQLTRLASRHHGPPPAPGWFGRLWAGLPSRGGRGVAPWQGLDVPSSPTAAGMQRTSLDVDLPPEERGGQQAPHAEPALPTRDDSAHGGCQGDPTLQQLAEHVEQETGEAVDGEGGTRPAQPQRRVSRAVAIEHQRRQLEKLAAMRRQEQEQREQQGEQQQQEGSMQGQEEPAQAERQQLALRPSPARPKQERWPRRLQRWLMHGFITPVFG